jgi:hypothetical protein
MSSVVISGDTSGSVTLQAPSVAGTTVLTLPATSGTVITGPGGVTSVASGGTGAATLTANNVILGNGTSAVAFVAPSTTGNLLTSNGTTWTSAAAPSSTPTTAQVLSATAGATAGAVGTYAWLVYTSGGPISAGSTFAGSTLRYASIIANGAWNTNPTPFPDAASSSTLSGTWRVLGTSIYSSSYNPGTLFLRIS